MFILSKTSEPFRSVSHSSQSFTVSLVLKANKVFIAAVKQALAEKSVVLRSKAKTTSLSFHLEVTKIQVENYRVTGHSQRDTGYLDKRFGEMECQRSLP